MKQSIIGIIIACVFIIPNQGMSAIIGQVSNIACAPTNTHIAVASNTNGDIWLTTNDGKTWQKAATLFGQPLSSTQTQPDAGHCDPGTPLDDNPRFFADNLHEIQKKESNSILESSTPIPPSSCSMPSASLFEPTVKVLSVNDLGEFCAFYANQLYMGNHLGIQKTLPLLEVNDIRYDLNHRLWITTRSGILLMENGRVSRSWRIVEANQLGRNHHQPGLVLTSPKGIWSIQTQPTSPTIRRIDPDRGIQSAVISSKNTLFSNSRNQLFATSADRQSRRRLPNGPGEIQKIIVDSSETLYVKTSANRWFAQTHFGFRPIRSLAICTDAKGRVWQTTPLGQTGPQKPISTMQVTHLAQAKTILAQINVHPPNNPSPIKSYPCPHGTQFLLPTVNLTFKAARIRGLKLTALSEINTQWAKTSVFAAVGFSWQLGKQPRYSCFEHIEKQSTIQREKQMNQIEILNGLAKDILQQPVNKTPLEKEMHSLQQSKAMALLQLWSDKPF